MFLIILIEGSKGSFDVHNEVKDSLQDYDFIYTGGSVPENMAAAVCH